MRQCAWIECKQEVANPINRRSIWCPEHLTEQIVNHAYEPTGEQIADRWVDEWAIREEAKRLALASLNQWTWKERVLSCVTLLLLSLAASWAVIAVVVVACRFFLWLLRLVHLA